MIDRLSYFYEHENSNIHRAAHTLAARATDAYEAAREKVRALPQRAVGRTRSSSCAARPRRINLVAQSLGPAQRRRGRRDRHHPARAPRQHRAVAAARAEKGARLRVAPVDDHGQIILEEYEKLLGPRTQLVAFTQVSNALGTVTPVAEMIAHRAPPRRATCWSTARRRVSHMPVDVQALDCDFYVFSGHKVFAPTGIGVRLRQGERARGDAALAGRRQHDRGRHVRADASTRRRRTASRPAPATSPTRSASAPRSTTSAAIGIDEHRRATSTSCSSTPRRRC